MDCEKYPLTNYFSFLDKRNLITEYTAFNRVLSLKIKINDINRLKPLDGQEPDSVTNIRLTCMGFKKSADGYVLSKHKENITKKIYKDDILIHLKYEPDPTKAKETFQRVINNYDLVTPAVQNTPTGPVPTESTGVSSNISVGEIPAGEIPGQIPSTSNWQEQSVLFTFSAPPRGRGHRTMHSSRFRTSRREPPPPYNPTSLYGPPPSYDSVMSQSAASGSDQSAAGSSSFSPPSPASSRGQGQNPFQARGRGRGRR
ncbi:hypothetical protein FE392_07705 [Xenorhabdus sp. 12]|uniref:Uncharacterized protein n=1 Tax=Xenorhabdus santafensis TaxID=2582833 RepID=A0ABU4S8X1_9GAMM|nr:hypothetical protein [Xenorhabdus sp. 12]MDX7987216.1 hypothetical protein [Xenorhabdus sp. 12]